MFALGYFGASYYAPGYWPPGLEGGQHYQVSIGLSASAGLASIGAAEAGGSVSLAGFATLAPGGAAAGLATIDLAAHGMLRAAGAIAGEIKPVGGRIVRIQAKGRTVRSER